MAHHINRPLPLRRREPLLTAEAVYFADRFGRRSLQAMSAMTGASQASVRRILPRIKQAVQPPEAREMDRSRRAQGAVIAVSSRTATLSLAEAAREIGLTPGALRHWLSRERWIRRGRRGALIAGAAQVTAGLLNQPVSQVDCGSRVHMHYGAIRFTPRGMAMLRLGVQAPADQCR